MVNIDASWPWLALLALGAMHGINPGMGWLFAVALGLQERKGRAVWRALPPLALGHALAIGAVIMLAALAGLVVPLRYLKWLVAVTLLGFGLYRLARNRHPRFGGMRVGVRDLTIWSFLMASAHGAGLMVVPFILGSALSLDNTPVQMASGLGHGAHTAALFSGVTSEGLAFLVATLVHTLGYLLITGLLAVVVYEKLGLRLLRSVWLNLDVVWAATLILTALLTPLI